jgi:hypothetical protein
MKTIVKSLHDLLSKFQRRRSTPMSNRKVRLGVECLEDRQLLSTSTFGTISDGMAGTASQQLARDSVSLVAALAAGVDEKTTVITVHMNDDTFPNPSSQPFDVVIDYEEMRVLSLSQTDGSTNTYVVVRGVNGTTAASHAFGTGVKQVAATQGTSAPGAFVNFGGAVWEHVGTDSNSGWFEIWGQGVTQMSASTTQVDTVFLLFGGSAGGAVWEHVGRDSNSGWTKVWGAGVTEISCGIDSFGAPAVFCNFGGSVWEHMGQDSNTGWSKVWSEGITQISASQHQADTVFTLFGGSAGGAVSEHRGTDSNSGWTKVWAAGVTEISASSAQDDTVFCNFSGAVWEHSGMDSNSGWSKIWTQAIAQISASPLQADTVYTVFDNSANGAAWEHNGTDLNSGWSKIWAQGITQISAAPVQNDTAYVLFGGGAVWEHVGTDSNSGWFKIWDSGVTEISACLTEV